MVIFPIRTVEGSGGEPNVINQGGFLVASRYKIRKDRATP